MASGLTRGRERLCCNRGEGSCGGEVVTIATPLSREVFIRCAPPRDSQKTPREQAAEFYGCLPRLLENAGARMSDVLHERVFFRDIKTDFQTIGQVRRAAYGESGIRGDALPAASYVLQPPCRPGQAIEFQVQAIASNGCGSVKIQPLPPAEEGLTSKIVEIGDVRHLYISNIRGQDSSGAFSTDFRAQSDTMFAKSVLMLDQQGARFTDVVRTWCYLDDIDRDYAEFNLSRNAFFEEQDIFRLPASTGIRAGLYPPEAMCGFDLYAILNPEDLQIEVMHTPTLNEADEYGSAFSRGMKVVYPEKTVLFISGTASVDERGDTVHLDDIEKQIHRMLLNVQELLRPHGSSFGDIVQAITYLKTADYFETFQGLCQKWDIANLPNTIVEAGVCRPNLLCELEAIAILPNDR